MTPRGHYHKVHFSAHASDNTVFLYIVIDMPCLYAACLCQYDELIQNTAVLCEVCHRFFNISFSSNSRIRRFAYIKSASLGFMLPEPERALSGSALYCVAHL